MLELESLGMTRLLERCFLVVTKVSVAYSLSDICDYISDILDEDCLQSTEQQLLVNLMQRRRIMVYSTPHRMNQCLDKIKKRVEE